MATRTPRTMPRIRARAVTSRDGLDAVEILQPAVPLNKGLVKLDEEILEKTQVSASNADGFPCGVEFLHIGRSPLSFYGLREERKRAAHAALF